MRPGPFQLFQPKNLADAVAAAAQGAVPLAGGQSLLQAMRLRQREPTAVVDLRSVQELRPTVEQTDGNIRIGALVTHDVLSADALVAAACPWLIDAAQAIGDVQVRKLGTIVGNVCWADPRANMAVALLASDAVVNALANDGARRVAITDLFSGFRTTSLAGALVTSIDVPVMSRVGIYLEFCRQPQDLALCNVCIVHDTDHNTYRVAVGGVDVRPLRMTTLEAALNGNDADAQQAALNVDLDPAQRNDLGETFAPFQYRLELARTLINRALGTLRNNRP